MWGSSAIEGDGSVPCLWTDRVSGRRVRSAENRVSYQEYDVASRSLGNAGASRQLPPVQTSKATKPACKDHQCLQLAPSLRPCTAGSIYQLTKKQDMLLGSFSDQLVLLLINLI